MASYRQAKERAREKARALAQAQVHAQAQANAQSSQASAPTANANAKGHGQGQGKVKGANVAEDGAAKAKSARRKGLARMRLIKRRMRKVRKITALAGISGLAALFVLWFLVSHYSFTAAPAESNPKFITARWCAEFSTTMADVFQCIGKPKTEFGSFFRAQYRESLILECVMTIMYMCCCLTTITALMVMLKSRDRNFPGGKRVFKLALFCVFVSFISDCVLKWRFSGLVSATSADLVSAQQMHVFAMSGRLKVASMIVCHAILAYTWAIYFDASVANWWDWLQAMYRSEMVFPTLLAGSILFHTCGLCGSIFASVSRFTIGLEVGSTLDLLYVALSTGYALFIAHEPERVLRDNELNDRWYKRAMQVPLPEDAQAELTDHEKWIAELKRKSRSKKKNK